MMIIYKLDMPSTSRVEIGLEAIKGLCNELSNLYGKKYRSLALYNRLVSTVAESKFDTHTTKWKKFLDDNIDHLKTTNAPKTFKFVYNNNIFINFGKILSEEKSAVVVDTIWEHLLTINAVLDETNSGKELLKSVKARKESEKKANKSESEHDFIGDAVKEIASNMENNGTNADDPMSTIVSLVSSPMFASLVSNMKEKVESGDLDINSLMGTVTGMMSKIEQNGPGPRVKLPVIEDNPENINELDEDDTLD